MKRAPTPMQSKEQQPNCWLDDEDCMQPVNENNPELPAPSKGATFQRRILRLSSFTVAGVVSLLMISAVIPPMFGNESDRAVVNAPIILLTAPIAGEVQSLTVAAGQTVDAGVSVARIMNSRIDQSTLISLEEKALSARESIQAVRNKRESDLQYLSSIDREILRHTAELERQFETEITELRSLLAEAQATSKGIKAIVDRQTALVLRQVASSEMLQPTAQQYAAAQHRSEAALSRLNKKIAKLDALKQGIYVGDDLVAIAVLVQKRRDIDLDAKRLAIEEQELLLVTAGRQRLIAEERQRLDSLSKAELVAPMTGEVLTLGAAVGRHVNAGDTIASVVDCGKAFVVAIFSYRQGQNLRVGSRFKIEDASFDHGTVVAILPKTSEKVDERFAVPFPQTERRELYVLIKPDRSPEDIVKPASLAGGWTTSCNTGQWVTVARESGWLPSASSVWRETTNALQSLASAPASGTPLENRGRP